jgi:uncharacterized protein
MAIIFDPAKNAKNIAERGLSFDLVERLDWHTALIKEDTRKDYGEPRLQVWAMLGSRLHVAVVTPRGSHSTSTTHCSTVRSKKPLPRFRQAVSGSAPDSRVPGLAEHAHPVSSQDFCYVCGRVAATHQFRAEDWNVGHLVEILDVLESVRLIVGHLGRELE